MQRFIFSLFLLIFVLQLQKERSTGWTVLYIGNTIESKEAVRVLNEADIAHRVIDLTKFVSYDEELAPPTVLSSYGTFKGMDEIKRYARLYQHWNK